MADPVGLTNTAATAPQHRPQATRLQTRTQADPVAEAARLGGPLGSAAVGALQSASDHENTPEPTPPTTIYRQNSKNARTYWDQLGDVPEEKASDAAKETIRP